MTTLPFSETAHLLAVNRAAEQWFDAWSAHYDRSILQQLVFKPSHRAMLESLHIVDGTRVLDVGCGTGRFALEILRRHPDAWVVGLDLSARMLEVASANCRSYLGDRLELVPGNSASLPFPDQAFDAVTCSHSFHHYPEQGRVVAEMHRVLRPGGRLVLVDGDRDGWWGRVIFDGCVPLVEGMVRHCSAQQTRDLMHAAGFERIGQRRHGILAPFLLSVAFA